MGSMAPAIGVDSSTMRISKKTLGRLAKRRKFLESYDTIINAVLNELEKLEARKK